MIVARERVEAGDGPCLRGRQFMERRACVKKYALLFLVITLPATLSTSHAQEKGANASRDAAAVEALAAKRRGEAAARQRLERLLSPVGVRVEERFTPAQTLAHRELRILLTGPEEASAATGEESPSPAVEATVLGSRRRDGSLPRLRSLELSSDHLLVLTVSEDTRLRWWTLIPDPRLLRAEAPGADNQLTGRVIRLRSAEFALDLPDDEEAVELRLYQPRFVGGEYVLALVSSIALRND